MKRVRHLISACSFIALASACVPADDASTGDEATGDRPSPRAAASDAPASSLTPAEPWTLTDPAPDEDGVTRVLIYHDMEGLSGQDDPRSFEFGKEEYAGGRELLTADVNAVIAGLFDGGADEVHVVDGHGSGNPEPDLLLDRLL